LGETNKKLIREQGGKFSALFKENCPSAQNEVRAEEGSRVKGSLAGTKEQNGEKQRSENENGRESKTCFVNF